MSNISEFLLLKIKGKCVLKVLTKITMRKINNTRIFVNKLETQDEKNNSGAAKSRISTIQKTKLNTKQKHSHTPDAVVVPCSLTCNPTGTLPNQVSYLKGSSMESFTLGPTPKIDFSCSAATAHLQWLQRGRIITNNLHKYSLSSGGIQY
jgi:hypothetical protein